MSLTVIGCESRNTLVKDPYVCRTVKEYRGYSPGLLLEPGQAIVALEDNTTTTISGSISVGDTVCLAKNSRWYKSRRFKKYWVKAL